MTKLKSLFLFLIFYVIKHNQNLHGRLWLYLTTKATVDISDVATLAQPSTVAVSWLAKNCFHFEANGKFILALCISHFNFPIEIGEFLFVKNVSNLKNE